MGRPMKNMSNFWFPGMYNILEAAARVLSREIGLGTCDVEELIDQAWLNQGRYMQSEAHAKQRLFLNAKRAMYQYVKRQKYLRQMDRKTTMHLTGYLNRSK